MFDRWLVTSRSRMTAALVVVWFAVLNGLVLLGYEGAVTLLAASVGFLAGTLLAYLGASPIRQSFARLFGAWRGAGALVLALALTLAIVLLGGAYLTGSPSLLVAESGPSEGLIYGLALGFGSSFRERLAPPLKGTPEEEREARKAGVRLLLVVCGAIAGVFALTFTAYLLIEYVVGPTIRLLAA